MLHRGEIGHPLWSSNSLGGRIRTPQLRVIVLELFQLNHELVVLGVGDRWGVVGVVGVLGVQDAFGQLSPAMARLRLGLAWLQLIASDGIVNHGPILAQFPYLCIRVSVDLPPTTRCGGRGSSAATGPHSGFSDSGGRKCPGEVSWPARRHGRSGGGRSRRGRGRRPVTRRLNQPTTISNGSTSQAMFELVESVEE